MQKTNFKTRLLALLTAAFMLVMCVPFAAFAEDVKSVTIYWNAADGTPLYTTTTNGNIEAPDAGDGYRWKDNMKNGEPVYVNTRDIVNWADLAANAGSVDNDGNGFYSFTKVEAPKRDLKVTFTVDKNLGTITDPAGAEKVDFTIAEDSQEQFNIPTVEAVDGYKFVGWTSDDTEINWDSNAKSFGVSSSWPDKVEIKAVFEKKESKKLNIKFTVDAALGTITNPAGAKEVTFNDIEADTDQQFVVPTVEGKNGYKFVGWASEDGTVKWDANTKTFGVSANWPENLEIKAVFEKEATKTINVKFTVDASKGTITDPAGAKEVTFNNLDANTDQQFVVPTVKAKDGYKFVGWFSKEAGISWQSDAKTFGISNNWPENTVIEAVFEPENKDEKTLNIKFTVDEDKGVITVPAGAKFVTFENIDANTDQQFEVPTVKAKAGYKFVGWASEDGTVKWDANAKTFGVSSNWPANLEIKAVFEAEGAEKVLNIKFTVDAKKGTITDPAEAKFVTYENIDPNTDQQFLVPKVEAKSGYKFVGWASEDGTVKWDANASTFGVANNWPENLEIKAVFEEVKSDNNGSSSSTSSSSSSSNKTTTASNQKQVVKAAAAPANTTKVLPKTGASNVAPLLGGSLAVVALLMGYGVYGLVLRKKD